MNICNQPWKLAPNKIRSPGGREILEDDAAYDRKMLGSFIYEGRGHEENLRRWKIPHKTIREGGWGKEYIIIGPDQTSYFSFSRMDVKGNAEVPGTGFPRVAITMEGSGKFLFEGGSMELRKGDEIFLPWDIRRLSFEGDVSVIFCNPEGAAF